MPLEEVLTSGKVGKGRTIHGDVYKGTYRPINLIASDYQIIREVVVGFKRNVERGGDAEGVVMTHTVAGQIPAND